MPSELDYKSRIHPYGGSPKGREVRRCPRALKELARKLAVEDIAGGNESYFIHNPNHGSRFTAAAFAGIVLKLWEELPDECRQYFGGREDKAAYLISQRVHKMYYVYDKGGKSRGKSREHPDEWKS